MKPSVLSHVYWKDKSAFQLQEDTNDFWVVFAVEEGSFAYKIGSQEGTASFGDLVFCPPGVAFRRAVLQPLSFHVILLRWDSADDGIPAGKVTLHDLHRLTSSYTYLRKWAELGSDASAALRHHFIMDIWMQLAEEKHSAYRNPSTQHGTRDSLIEKAVQYLQEHAADHFSLKRLAKELGLTQVQFTRRFKKSAGMPPLDYLTSLRLQKVQKLLLESDLTLQQIAGQCGFENEFYLSRVFKKRMHIPPTQYRKLHRL
ncbi:AraC family transcriptional regulator [Bacillus sp. 3255]|uniref:AraC family transcriptional regulator n=1 Tax=Bacillus sp. 3255 TaxID=2817904 RepID=UPI0028593F6D|nr:AraC family transcriptional regulator [Bacillus sp. 3255]MDR6879042.1 AraC-like DNA-binding protein [Bacillus sp. 3255]